MRTEKTKRIRIRQLPGGEMEVTLRLPKRATQTADKFAKLLPATRGEILEEYFTDSLDGLVEGLGDHCSLCWSFESKEAAEAFLVKLGWSPSSFKFEKVQKGRWAYFFERPMPAAA